MKAMPQLEAPLPRYIWVLCQAGKNKGAQFNKNSPFIVQHKYQTNKQANSLLQSVHLEIIFLIAIDKPIRVCTTRR